jgi:hypothetical protein
MGALTGREPWEGEMTVVRWARKAREYVGCNRAFGCLCQFNSLPTRGKCHEVVPIVDAKASPERRDAVLRTMSGLGTKPGATLFQKSSATFDTITTLSSPKSTSTSTRPRVPNGFEYDVCEVGSGTARTQGPVALMIEASHARFARF